MKNQQFKEHFDWLDPVRDTSLMKSGNRATSFFVYLEASCEGGATAFPRIKRPKAPELCDALLCHDENGNEVDWLEVKPKVGRAIFWHNLDPAGEVDENTLHAGKPVTKGIKVGLNIWTREKNWKSAQ